MPLAVRASTETARKRSSGVFRSVINRKIDDRKMNVPPRTPDDSVRSTVAAHATGTAVILTAVLAATGTAIGLGGTANAIQAADAASPNAGTIGLVGGIALALILLIAYYCGGYVAGRMARFDGIKQCVAVWFWAIIIAVVLAIARLIAGSQFNILANVNASPDPGERGRPDRGQHHHRRDRADHHRGWRDPWWSRRDALPPPHRQGRPRPLTTRRHRGGGDRPRPAGHAHRDGERHHDRAGQHDRFHRSCATLRRFSPADWPIRDFHFSLLTFPKGLVP
jgi:hypothetical protein